MGAAEKLELRGLTAKSVTITIIFLVIYSILSQIVGQWRHNGGYAAPPVFYDVNYGAAAYKGMGFSYHPTGGVWTAWGFAYFGFFLIAIVLSMMPAKRLSRAEKVFILAAFGAGLLTTSNFGANMTAAHGWGYMNEGGWPGTAQQADTFLHELVEGKLIPVIPSQIRGYGLYSAENNFKNYLWGGVGHPTRSIGRQSSGSWASGSPGASCWFPSSSSSEGSGLMSKTWPFLRSRHP